MNDIKGDEANAGKSKGATNGVANTLESYTKRISTINLFGSDGIIDGARRSLGFRSLTENVTDRETLLEIRKELKESRKETREKIEEIIALRIKILTSSSQEEKQEAKSRIQVLRNEIRENRQQLKERISQIKDGTLKKECDDYCDLNNKVDKKVDELNNIKKVDELKAKKLELKAKLDEVDQKGEALDKSIGVSLARGTRKGKTSSTTQGLCNIEAVPTSFKPVQTQNTHREDNSIAPAVYLKLTDIYKDENTATEMLKQILEGLAAAYIRHREKEIKEKGAFCYEHQKMKKELISEMNSMKIPLDVQNAILPLLNQSFTEDTLGYNWSPQQIRDMIAQIRGGQKDKSLA